jgi:hypothetical protein
MSFILPTDIGLKIFPSIVQIRLLGYRRMFSVEVFRTVYACHVCLELVQSFNTMKRVRHGNVQGAGFFTYYSSYSSLSKTIPPPA